MVEPRKKKKNGVATLDKTQMSVFSLLQDWEVFQQFQQKYCW